MNNEDSKSLPVLQHWEKHLVVGYQHPSTGVFHGPDWPIEEWNVYIGRQFWGNGEQQTILLMGEWGFISMMIEMVLAGASKKDLTIKLKDSKAVKREAAVFNV